MRVLRDLDRFQPPSEGLALAIGNFDGLHLGHQAVLAAMLEGAKECGASPGVLTFEPHPRRVFSREGRTIRLMPLSMKLRALRAQSMAWVVLQRFNLGFAENTAERFVEEWLVKKLGVRLVVTGENFVFGKNRGGNAELLRRMGENLGFSYISLPPLTLDGGPCSSSRIRAYLAEGKPERAARLLGRPYTVEGRVRHGDGRGRDLGAATANLALPGLFLPAYGVYAVRYSRPGAKRGKLAVANFGVRPTFGPAETPRLEVHALDGSHPEYGELIRVEFHKFLRPEHTFPDAAALKAQIAEDIRQTREVLA